MQWKDSGGTGFEPAPVGAHPARCVKIIDIGTQRSEYQGKVIIRRQCVIGWELPTELIQEGELKGKPFLVSKFYTASLNEKATLAQDLATWRGKALTDDDRRGYAAKNLIGKTCLVNIIHTDKGKAQVKGVMQLPKNMVCPPQISESVFFSLDDFNQATFDCLSDGFKRMVEASPEYQQIKTGSRDSYAPNYPDPADDNEV